MRTKTLTLTMIGLLFVGPVAAAPGVAPALAPLQEDAEPIREGGEDVTLSGEIEAVDYDENDEVVSVAIYDPDWGSVLVLNRGKGEALRNHVGKRVRATGRVQLADDSSGYPYAIEVQSFELEEPEWEDE